MMSAPQRRRSLMPPFRRLSRSSITAVALGLVLLAASSSPGAQAPKSRPGVPPDVDALVARVMKAFEVPGLALAVVKDGKVVLAKGYGLRKLGETAPVDARTL